MTIIRKRGIVTASFPRKQEFIEKVRECQALARKLYEGHGFYLDNFQLPIVFVAKGNNAGMARFRRNSQNGSVIYNLEFNIDAIMKNWDDMVNDTIPHEIAHIVDFAIHGRSDGHGKKWKRIAHSLGCTGKRTHDYSLEKARVTTKYVYRATCGNETKVGPKVHRKIQTGSVYTMRGSNGRLTGECFTGRVVRA